FEESGDPVLTFEFLDLLRRHRIEVYPLNRDIEVEGRQFSAGEAFVVPVDQAQSRLAMSFFERQATFEKNVFYDISTWVLPSSFGIEAVPLRAEEYSPDLLGL